MKKVLLIVALIATVAFTAYCIVNDAKTGNGFFTNTATYREYVSEGHR